MSSNEKATSLQGLGSHVPPYVGPAGDDSSESLAGVSSEEWNKKNSRRIALIKKLNRQGLTAEEQKEFETLQQQVLDFLDKTNPGPPIDPDALEDLKQELNNS